MVKAYEVLKLADISTIKLFVSVILVEKEIWETFHFCNPAMNLAIAGKEKFTELISSLKNSPESCLCSAALYIFECSLEFFKIY